MERSKLTSILQVLERQLLVQIDEYAMPTPGAHSASIPDEFKATQQVLQYRNAVPKELSKASANAQLPMMCIREADTSHVLRGNVNVRLLMS